MKTRIFAALVGMFAATAAHASPNVVASIKPVHSLVAGVMKGVGEPSLLVDGAGSPHSYALKPSQARTLSKADIVFWMGHDLEAFLEKAVENVASKAVSAELFEAPGLMKLKTREEGHGDHDDHDDRKHEDEHDHDEKHAKEEKHDDHDHDDHKHEKEHDHDHEEKHAKEEKHDDHDHKDHEHDDHKHEEEHGHDEHKHEEKHEEHAGHDGHNHGEYDMHVWLDPVNAKALVASIRDHLSKIDPENAATYKKNAEALSAKLSGLVKEVEGELASVKTKGYVVFHDAYQYFEERFGTKFVGALTVTPEVMPGAERVKKIKKQITNAHVACVFSEPQFEPKLVKVLTEGTSVNSAELDPLGAGIENGEDLYFKLIHNMAHSMKHCLGS